MTFDLIRSFTRQLSWGGGGGCWYRWGPLPMGYNLEEVEDGSPSLPSNCDLGLFASHSVNVSISSNYVSRRLTLAVQIRLASELWLRYRRPGLI